MRVQKLGSYGLATECEIAGRHICGKKTNFGKICGRAIFIFFSRTAKIDEVPPNVSWEMSVKINDRI